MPEDIKIGISGGTFDPIHYGHLIIAENIRNSFKLDKVIFVPAGLPPHKKHLKVTSSLDRLNMVKKAVSSNSYFEVSSVEVEREGYTYTIDTLKHFRKTYGEAAKLFFITGADVIKELHLWKDYSEILSMCSFVTALRPEYNDDEFYKAIEHYRSNFNANIYIADAPMVQISSTDIRNRIAENRSIKYLLPECVEEYIFKNNLYK
ncbi:MAG: nicotinate-nucleotide adenylyltransferase [Bacillota bacterium]|nr:nicotinate-nucleotide adenylyltransferase [Bacillota bacterium]